jgi:hypothetical protein
MISLYVSLGSHRYGTLEGKLAYVPVMDPGFGCDMARVANLLLQTWLPLMFIDLSYQTLSDVLRVS